MSKPAIKVEGLWKEYVVGHAQARHGTFYDLLTHSLKAPLNRLRKLGGQAEESERFWALQDVNFEVQPGEVVGVIGRNGAGKSTLLKILSRITAPSIGRIEVRGRLASLLEVGTGFHPELSGRENIYLNGAILGMTRREVARKFDEIVAFAEIEKFIDTPVKRYSSGMYVRLAFAVAANLEPDILVVDEVLAVGDLQFQKKCLGKMGEVSEGGRTVLFVSHNLSAITQLCGKALLLGQGQLKATGTASEIVKAYTQSLTANQVADELSLFGELKGRLGFERVLLNGKENSAEFIVSPDEPVRVELHGHSKTAVSGLIVMAEIKRDGQRIISQQDSFEPIPLPQGGFVSNFEFPSMFLSPGEYFLQFGAFNVDTGEWVWTHQQTPFLVLEEWHPHYQPRNNMGVVNLPVCGSRKAATA